MPGTVPSKVRLDPFRRVVGIHWGGDADEALALAIAIRMTMFLQVAADPSQVETALRYRNPFDWSTVPPLPPLYWSPRLLFADGWQSGEFADIVVTGLQDHGAPPDYYWPSLATFDAATYGFLRWQNPGGSSTGIDAPILSLGETTPRQFLSGDASISDYYLDGTVQAFRTDYAGGSAEVSGRTFEYAGAVAINVGGTAHPIQLIGGPDAPEASVNYELWQLYLPVTA
jgi:hypothetical protein